MITALTTAPRDGENHLPAVYKSITDSGFPAPYVFAEPGCDLTGIPPEKVIQRPERLGCFGNYLQTLRDLLELDKDAQTLCVFQDDIILASDCAKWLEVFLWPSDKGGVVSLYSPNYPGYEVGVPVGFNRQKDLCLIGACAMVFKREFVEKLVTHTNWRGAARQVEISDPLKKKAVDAWVGHVAKEEGYTVYYPNPSLCQHIAEHSAVGHGGNDQQRQGFYYRRSEAFSGKSPFALWTIPEWRYDHTGKMFVRTPVDVIIPAWNCIDLTEKCLVALARQKETYDNFRVIYVDNGSDEGVVDQVRELAAFFALDLKVIAFPENRGFTAAVNAGIEASEGHVLLLNNDCYMHSDCLRNMMRHLLSNPKYASVGPLTDDQGWQSVKIHNRLAEQQGRRRSLQTNILSGFCQLKRKEAIESIGSLDSNLTHGLGTDNDWCKRAITLGWTHGIAMDAFANHDHKSTFKRSGQDRKAYQRAAVDYLSTKT